MDGHLINLKSLDGRVCYPHNKTFGVQENGWCYAPIFLFLSLYPSKRWNNWVELSQLSFLSDERVRFSGGMSLLDRFYYNLNSRPGLCSTHESWVKFDSTLTQMSRVRVESAVKIQDMSWVRVESRWLSFESELSQLDTAWVKVESLIFRRENVKILQFSVALQRKNQPIVTFDRTPPPPRSTSFPQIR